MGRLHSVLARYAHGQAIWSIFDQGIVSLGNFGVTLILARALSPDEFGVYALILAILMFLNGMLYGLIAYPLTILHGKEGAPPMAQLSGGAAALVLSLTPAMAVPIFAACAYLERFDLFVWVLAASLCWQLQDTFRRSLMAQLRHSETLPGDAISYLGQIGLVLGWILAGASDLSHVFGAMALTSSAGALVQAAQLQIRLPPRRMWGVLTRELWRISRPIAAGMLIAQFQVLSMPWVIGFFHGHAAAGALRVAISVLTLSNPILTGVQNMITPSVVAARARGARAALHSAYRNVNLGAIVTAPYFLLLLVVPWLPLQIFGWDDSVYPHLSWAVQIGVITFLASHFASASTGFLDGMDRTDLPFKVQIVTTVLFAILALPLGAWGGVAAGMAGNTVVHVVRLGILLRVVRRFVGERGDAPFVPSLAVKP